MSDDTEHLDIVEPVEPVEESTEPTEPVEESTEPTEPTEKPVAPETTEEPKPKPRKGRAKPAQRKREPYAVVGPGATDTVHYSRALPAGRTGPRNSITVRHIQRALSERGFSVSPTGHYADTTEHAVRAFQQSQGAAETGVLTRDQFTALFDGDPNVTLEIHQPDHRVE